MHRLRPAAPAAWEFQVVSCHSIPNRDAGFHSLIRFGFVYYTRIQSMRPQSRHNSHISFEDSLKFLS